MCDGRRFQADGAATEKELLESWRLNRSTIKSPRDVDRSRVSQTIMVSNFNYGDVTAPRAAEFCEITQNNGYYAIQGHSRSSISSFKVINFLKKLMTLYDLFSYQWKSRMPLPLYQ